MSQQLFRKLIATAVVTGATFCCFSFAASHHIITKRKLKIPFCNICQGIGYYVCKLCNGNGTIKWSPLYDPVFINPCVCPTCSGFKVQRCLNCLGHGGLKS